MDRNQLHEKVVYMDQHIQKLEEEIQQMNDERNQYIQAHNALID